MAVCTLNNSQLTQLATYAKSLLKTLETNSSKDLEEFSSDLYNAIVEQASKQPYITDVDARTLADQYIYQLPVFLESFLNIEKSKINNRTKLGRARKERLNEISLQISKLENPREDVQYSEVADILNQHVQTSTKKAEQYQTQLELEPVSALYPALDKLDPDSKLNTKLTTLRQTTENQLIRNEQGDLVTNPIKELKVGFLEYLKIKDDYESYKLKVVRLSDLKKEVGTLPEELEEVLKISNPFRLVVTDSSGKIILFNKDYSESPTGNFIDFGYRSIYKADNKTLKSEYAFLGSTSLDVFEELDMDGDTLYNEASVREDLYNISKDNLAIEDSKVIQEYIKKYKDVHDKTLSDFEAFAKLRESFSKVLLSAKSQRIASIGVLMEANKLSFMDAYFTIVHQAAENLRLKANYNIEKPTLLDIDGVSGGAFPTRNDNINPVAISELNAEFQNGTLAINIGKSGTSKIATVADNNNPGDTVITTPKTISELDQKVALEILTNPNAKVEIANIKGEYKDSKSNVGDKVKILKGIADFTSDEFLIDDKLNVYQNGILLTEIDDIKKAFTEQVNKGNIYYNLFNKGDVSMSVTNVSENTIQAAWINNRDFTIRNYAIPYELVDGTFKRVNKGLQYSVEEPAVAVSKTSDVTEESGITTEAIDGLRQSNYTNSGLTKSEKEAVQKWWKNHPLSKLIPLHQMYNVVNSKGYAKWSKSGIFLYNGSNMTDLYHESWHAFSQLFLTGSEKKDLYNNVRNTPGTFKTYEGNVRSFSKASNLELEEWLAEEFRKYSIAEGNKKYKTKGLTNVFKRIWSAIKTLFKNSKITDYSTTALDEIFDKLYTGKGLTQETYDVANVSLEDLYFEGVRLNNLELRSGNTLSPLEVRDINISITNAISNIVSRINLQRNDKSGMTAILKPENSVKIYGMVKNQFEVRISNTLSELKVEKDLIKIAKLERALKILREAVDDFGDVKSITAGVLGTPKGSSLIKNYIAEEKLALAKVKQEHLEALEQTGENAQQDADAENSSSKEFDIAGNDLSIMARSSKDVRLMLGLIKDTSRKDSRGVFETAKNDLGFPAMAPVNRTFNLLKNLLENSENQDHFYKILTDASKTYSIVEQVLSIMGQPKDNPELWKGFYQTFYASRIRLTKVNTFSSSDKITQLYAPGYASELERAIVSNFTNSRALLKKGPNGEIMLDLAKIDTLLKNKVLSDGYNFKVFQSSGLLVDELNNNALKSDLNASGKSKYKAVFLKEKIAVLNRYNTALAKSTINSDYTIKIMDPVKQLAKMDYGGYVIASNNKDVQKKGLKPGQMYQASPTSLPRLVVASAQFNKDKTNLTAFSLNPLFETLRVTTNVVNVTSVTTATGEKKFESGYKSSLSKLVQDINNSKTYKELQETTSWLLLKKENNGFLKHNTLFNAIFNPVTGLKRSYHGEEVVLVLEQLAGTTQVAEEGGVITNSEGYEALGSTSDVVFTRDLNNFYLRPGAAELPSHADKSTRLTLYVKTISPKNVDKQLYIDLEHINVFTPKEDANYDSKLLDALLPNLQGEYERVMHFNKSQQNLLKYSKRGREFVIFDGLIEASDLEILKKEALKEDPKSILELFEENPELKERVVKSFKEFFTTTALNTYKGVAKDYVANTELLNKTLSKFRKKSTNKVMQQRLLDAYNYNTPAMSSVKNFTELSKLTNKALLSNSRVAALVKNQLIGGFVVNTFLQKLDTTLFVYGDPAMYKSSADFTKRIAAIASTGIFMMTDNLTNAEIDAELANNSYAKTLGYNYTMDATTLNTAVVKDVNTVSKQSEELKKEHLEYFKSMMDEEDAVKAIDSTYDSTYNDMDEADAQGLVTFDAYKALMIGINKWNVELEEAYQQIITNPEAARSLEFLKVFPPVKFQYFGPLLSELKPGDYSAIAFHKYSLAPLIPGAYSKDSNLHRLHDKMLKENIHYLTFGSGSKVESVANEQGGLNPFYKNGRVLNEAPFIKNVISKEYLKEQLNIDKKYKTKVTFPTQLRKLIELGIYENGKVTNAELGHLAKQYNDLIIEMVSKNIAKFRENFEGDPQKLKTFLIESLKSKDVSAQDLHDIATSFDEHLGTLNLDLTTNSEAAQKALLTFAKSIFKPKFNGEALIQMSSVGWETASSELSTEYSNDNLKYYSKNANGTTKMEVLVGLQGSFKNLIYRKDVKALAKEKGVSSLEALNLLIKDSKWLVENEALITMVGVRIPTQGLNSMEALVIKEFLPESVGPVIIPPANIVAKTGSDFDVDKMTILMPTSKKVKKGAEYVFENEASDQNMLMGLITKILTHPKNFNALTLPLDIDVVQKATQKIMLEKAEMLPGKTAPKEISETASNTKSLVKTLNEKYASKMAMVFTTEYNNDKQGKMGVAKKALGIAAVFNTFKVLFEKSDFGIPGETLFHTNHTSDGLLSFAGHSDQQGYKINLTINEMINGLLDVAKNDWIFDAHGTQVLLPTMLGLVGMGVNYQTAIAFLSYPKIQEYVNLKYYSEINPFINAEELSKIDNRVNILEQAAINGPVFENFDDESEYFKTVEHVLNSSSELSKVQSEDVDNSMLKEFFKIQKMLEPVTSITTQFTSDTKDEIELKKVRSKGRVLDNLIKSAFYDIKYAESESEKFQYRSFQIRLTKLQDTIPGYFNVSAYILANFAKSFPITTTLSRNLKSKTILTPNNVLADLFFKELYGTNTDTETTEFWKGSRVSLSKTLLPKRLTYLNPVTGITYQDTVLITQRFNNLAIKATEETLEESYEKLGTYLPGKIYFMNNGVANFKSFKNYLYEKARLRTELSITEFAESFKIKVTNKETLEKSYEKYLNTKALDNTYNDHHLFYSNTSYADRILKLTTTYGLSQEYAVLSSLTSDKMEIKNKTITNLKSTERFLEKEVSEQYYQDIVNLMDEGVMKHEDPVVNKAISEMFKLMPIYGFMQSGLVAKNEYSINRFTPQDQIRAILSKSLANTELSKEYLKDLEYFHKHLKRSYGERLRNNVQYLNPKIDTTLKASITDYASLTDGITVSAFFPTTLNTAKDSIFLVDTDVKNNNNMISTAGKSLLIAKYPNHLGLETVGEVSEEAAAKKIDAFLSNVEGLLEAGSDIVLQKHGYGKSYQKTFPVQYAKLSFRLYELTGYLNPGFLQNQDIMNVVHNEYESKISDVILDYKIDMEVDDIMTNLDGGCKS